MYKCSESRWTADGAIKCNEIKERTEQKYGESDNESLNRKMGYRGMEQPREDEHTHVTG